MEIQARELLALGAQNVLIKGGHGSGAESVDLADRAGCRAALSARRVDTKNTHGTGCTLSSAIAAGLAKGLDLKAAVQDAKAYVTAAIAAADQLKIGHGHGPLHHFHEHMERRHDDATQILRSPPGPPPECWPRRPLREHKRSNGAWSPRGRSGCRGPACRPSASPSAFARSPAASSTSPCMRRAKWCRPSRCSMLSAMASPISATPPRSTGRARCRRRRSSPRCRSGLRPASMSPGSTPAAGRRCGTSFTRRSA